jgi:hypothetical protein
MDTFGRLGWAVIVTTSGDDISANNCANAADTGDAALSAELDVIELSATTGRSAA